MKIIITGGCGFIGSNAVSYFLKQGHDITVIDSCTYAAKPNIIKKLGVPLYKLDIATMPWHYVLGTLEPDVIINYAAFSHVDKSIDGIDEFIHSNYLGINNLLMGLRRYISETKKRPLLIHLSTDEVMGDLPFDSSQAFDESWPINPNNPYSATKAAADLLIRALYHTYKDFRYVICRPCNNYGRNQHMEKFIPTVISSVLRGTKIPIYGEGENIREWLWTIDLAEGIQRIIDVHSKDENVAEEYNFGSAESCTNLELVHKILDIMGESYDYISFVSDRPGHDRKYCVAWDKAYTTLSWMPKTTLDEGLPQVIEDIKSRIF